VNLHRNLLHQLQLKDIYNIRRQRKCSTSSNIFLFPFSLISRDPDRIYAHITSQKHRFAIATPALIERDSNLIEKFFQRAKAMILNSLNQVRSIVINTATGTEQAMIFLGKTFVVDKAYNSLNDAIAGCRSDILLFH
jgi:hypothetical protein